jgi:hypothetical protein
VNEYSEETHSDDGFNRNNRRRIEKSSASMKSHETSGDE